MAFYSCRNCRNLKTRIITKSSFANRKKDKIRSALGKHDPDSLGLDFPFNMTVYKRVLKDDECKIIYCAEHLFNRDLYIYRENLDLDDLIPNKRRPCIKYK